MIIHMVLTKEELKGSFKLDTDYKYKYGLVFESKEEAYQAAKELKLEDWIYANGTAKLSY